MVLAPNPMTTLLATSTAPPPRVAALWAAFAWLLWCLAFGATGAALPILVWDCEALWPVLLLWLGGVVCGTALARSGPRRQWLGLAVQAVLALVAAQAWLGGEDGRPDPAGALGLATETGLAAGVALAFGLAMPLLAVERLLPAAALLGAIGSGAAALWVVPWLRGREAMLLLAPALALLAVAAALAPRRVVASAPSPDPAPRWSLVLAIVLTALLGSGRLAAVPADLQAAPGLLAAATALGLALVRGSAASAWLAVLCAALAFVPLQSPLADARLRTLVSAGRAEAIYDRSRQTMALYWDGERVAASGPDLPVEAVAATLLRASGGPGARTLLLGCGVSRYADTFAAAELDGIDLVPTRPVAEEVWWRLRAVGPAAAAPRPTAALPQPAVRGGWRARLAALPDACRDALWVGDLLHPGAVWQRSVLGQRELRRLVGAGLVLQPFEPAELGADHLRNWLAAAATAHPWNAVYDFGELHVLVSAAAAPDWRRGGAFADWPARARWLAYKAGCGEAGDLAAAQLGELAPWLAKRAPRDGVAGGGPGERGRSAALAVLAECLRTEDRPPPTGCSLYGWRQRQAAALRTAVTALLELDATRATRASALAARFLPMGAPRAELQAALGLPAADGAPLLDPAQAALRAFAIDPTVTWRLPAPFAGLPRSTAAVGELEDLGYLPPAERLAVIAVGSSPRAVALRARFAAEVAHALVLQLAAGPLSPDGVEALRELADPWLLGEIAAALGGERLAEALVFWRSDLPMPSAFLPLLASAPSALAAALARRTDAASRAALAELLLAPTREVRSAAAQSLRAGPMAAVGYDPDGPEEARKDAAARVRSWHDRGP